MTQAEPRSDPTAVSLRKRAVYIHSAQVPPSSPAEAWFQSLEAEAIIWSLPIPFLRPLRTDPPLNISPAPLF